MWFSSRTRNFRRDRFWIIACTRREYPLQRPPPPPQPTFEYALAAYLLCGENAIRFVKRAGPGLGVRNTPSHHTSLAARFSPIDGMRRFSTETHRSIRRFILLRRRTIRGGMEGTNETCSDDGARTRGMNEPLSRIGQNPGCCWTRVVVPRNNPIPDPDRWHPAAARRRRQQQTAPLPRASNVTDGGDRNNTIRIEEEGTTN